ncbi:protein of unknown function [Streptomyces sp. KY75]|nr:protein of unknown function [Streptomyces sp. KY75]CAD5981763.1 protein of unknown function [Streptomyces sp. KY70]
MVLLHRSRHMAADAHTCSCGEAAPPKPVVFQVSLYPYPVPASSYNLQLAAYVRFVEVSDYRVAYETRTVLGTSAAALHSAAPAVTRTVTDGEEVHGHGPRDGRQCEPGSASGRGPDRGTQRGRDSGG